MRAHARSDVEANVRALEARAPGYPALERYEEIARVLTGNANARTEDGIAWLGELVEAMAIPRLASYGVVEDDIPRIVDQARRASSMQGNPITLTDDELSEALRVAL